MGIKDDLLTIPEREDGGQTAYDRFDYQTAWGLSRLLDLHDLDKNYGVAFEFHDDIVAFDDIDAPSQAVFYQVKTKKTGNWSFAQITSRAKAKKIKKPSFAAKMFDNFVKFGATVEKLAFVSNQPLPEIILVHGQKSFSTAEKEKLEKFVTNLSAEIGSFDDAEHTKLFFFVFSDLNLTSYEQTIIGKIAEFLEKHIGPEIPPKPFALALNNMCRRRSKKLADLTSFEQLKSSKFVTRADMLKWLAHVKDQHERRPDWHSIAPDLDVSFVDKIKIERAWRDYEVTLRSRPNATTIAFIEQVRHIVDEALQSASSLNDIVNRAISKVRPLAQSWKTGCDDYFVTAIILYELKR